MASSPIAAAEESFETRDGLPHAAAKLNAGGEFSVVFLGGSITKGGNDGGFATSLPEWLGKEFPNAKVASVNSGINGTDSDFGAARTDRDVLDHKPDLVFVEFAVNDAGRDRTASMERIVRKIWKANPSTDIVFLYTVSENEMADYRSGKLPVAASHHENVAEFYGIPSIRLGTALVRELDSGKTWGQLIKDGCHPNEAGYALYSEEISESLTAAFGAGTPGRTLKAATLVPDLKVYPDPIAAKPMRVPVPLETKDGTQATQTFELPVGGVNWTEEPEFKVDGKNLWALYVLPFKTENGNLGGKLDAAFGINRTDWIPMRWFGERGEFHGPEGMPLWNGRAFAARENDLPVLVFIAPETGRYAFDVAGGTPSLTSHHKQIALNVVRFPWGKDLGESIAFFKTDSTARTALALEVETQLEAGEMIAFCLDTNVFYGGGFAMFPTLIIRCGLLPQN